MKIREFNKNLTIITTKKPKAELKEFLDKDKLHLLTDETRKEMVEFIVHKRMPIWVDLIPKDYDIKSLYPRGYMWKSTNKFDYTFIHTAETKINGAIKRETL